MFSSKEEVCDMSDKDSIVTRHIVMTNINGVIEYGFIPYSNHPLCKDKMIDVPKFSELRSSDRMEARRDFSSNYQKIEFSAFCSKASEGVAKLQDCINILTENGVWWGRMKSVKNKNGRDSVLLVESANELIEKYEPDVKDGSNPFCVIYSGLGMKPDEKSFKNYRIIACEFGGEDNIPLDHPFIKRHLRLLCFAQARSVKMNLAIVASIQQSDLVRFVSGEPSSFNNFSPAPSFSLEPMTEEHNCWKSFPHINFKNLSLIG